MAKKRTRRQRYKADPNNLPRDRWIAANRRRFDKEREREAEHQEYLARLKAHYEPPTSSEEAKKS